MSKRALLLTVLTIAVMTLAAAPFAYAGVTERVSVDSDGNQADLHSYGPTMTPDARYIVFSSYASDLVPGDTNDEMDVFVRDMQTGSIERVSVDSNGNQATGFGLWDSIYRPYADISDDGRYVAFYSSASNLVPDDTNNYMDVFVHDRQTGVTERVSVDSSGNQLILGGLHPSMTPDGRYVAFVSMRSRILYVHDRQTGATECVSLDINGNPSNRGYFLRPIISDDGRYVAFYSSAYNLVPGDTNMANDVFVYDRLTGVTERVSVSSNGMQANGHSNEPSMSPDGRYVAFHSSASNLVPDDTNKTTDVFIHDRQTGVTELVSVDSDGNQTDGKSLLPSLNADGRYVTFSSWAENLVPGDTNRNWDIFVRDRQTGVTERVSVDSDGNQTSYPITLCGSSSPNYIFCTDSFYTVSYWSSISADGKYVAFGSFAINTVPDDTNDSWDVFVHTRGPVVPGTIGDLITLVEDLYASGEIDNAGIKNSLLATLYSALKALENGNVHTARNTLLAFISKVQAQAEKHITKEAAALLIDGANNVLATLE